MEFTESTSGLTLFTEQVTDSSFTWEEKFIPLLFLYNLIKGKNIAMKKSLILVLVLVLPFCIEARNLWAFLTYSTFNSPQGAYVETYLSVAGNSVKYISTPTGKFQATVNVLMTFKLAGEIKSFKKYELKSPEIADTLNQNYEFLDEQRFQLPNGTYDFDLQISDKNKVVKPTPYTQFVVIDFPPDQPSVSGIQFVKSYSKSETEKTITKSGFDIVPYVYNFYPATESKVIFYAEIYNTNKLITEGDKYVMSYYIESFETRIKFFEYTRMKKNTVRPVDVVLAELNIENLATGNYNLVVEARNKKNEIVASRKAFFQRSNPGAKLSFANMTLENISNTFAEKITNFDTLKEYISCTFPISSGIERAYIKEIYKADRKDDGGNQQNASCNGCHISYKTSTGSMDKALTAGGDKPTKSLRELQQYFYGFWLKRDPNNPEKAWLAYKEQVNIANANFRTKVKKGYQTDRGRVYLEYGPPNARSERPNEPTSYPYEIWQYYTLGNNQRNRKFVFYAPEIVTNDYFLLHSDAIGEFYNSRWQVDLQSRTYAPVDLSETQTINSWGEMSKDYWDLP